MYIINPLVKEKKEIAIINNSEWNAYFPHLRRGIDSIYIEKRGEDFYIETICGMDSIIKGLQYIAENNACMYRA